MMRFPTVVGERDPIMRAGARATAGAVVGALVGLTLAGALYLSRPVQYSSTVALELTTVTPLVDLNPTGPKVSAVTIDTDAVLTASDPVVDAVAATSGRDADDVRPALSVRARPQSHVLEITYTTTESADAAREGVTSAAEAYLDLRERLIIDPVRGYVAAVVSETDTIQQQDLSADDTLSSGQVALENRLERAEAYEVDLPVPGSVLASASLPDARRGTIDVTLMSGALVGALVGFGVGLLWERRTARRRHQHPAVALPTAVDPARRELVHS